MIFGKKNYFYFSRIISQELILASLFIIKAILNLPCIVCREYFSIIFNVKKVRTIEDKIWQHQIKLKNTRNSSLPAAEQL
jgi:hypothetical protein